MSSAGNSSRTLAEEMRSTPVQWRYRIFDPQPYIEKSKPSWSEWMDANFWECGNYEGLVQFRRKHNV